MKRILLSLMATPLIAMASLSYAEENEFIVHDEEAGTITIYSQDKSYGITIQDKNLGASVVAKSIKNQNAYGSYYYWGRDAPSYQYLYPIGGREWSTNPTYGVEHNNDWGGGDDSSLNNRGYDTVNHVAINEAGRQGPCPGGYHVPSKGEWRELMMLRCDTNSGCSFYGGYLGGKNIYKMGVDLFLPVAGGRFSDTGRFELEDESGIYWTSTPSGSSDPNKAGDFFYSTRNKVNLGNVPKGCAFPIRCFKNLAIPLQTISFNTNGGTTIETQEVENGATLDEPTHPIKAHSIFAGWYMDNMLTQEFDFDTPISGDMTLYAKWDCEDGYYPLNNGQMCFTYETISIPDPNDPTKGITIMDRNLGATTTGAGSSADVESYGYYYQWGNNYGFPTKGTIDDIKNYNEANIDATEYGPGNYYSSSTFITDRNWQNDGDRAKIRNENLRGGAGDYDNNLGYDADNYVATKVTDRQGPCPDGTHVPSQGEWNALLKMWWATNSGNYEDGTYEWYENDSWGSYLYDYQSDIIAKDFYDEMQIPFAGYRFPLDASLYDQGEWSNLWSSSPYSASNPLSRRFYLTPGNLYANDLSNRTYANPVRCFSNEYIPETASLTLNSDNEVVDSQNVVVGTTATKPSSPTKSGYKFIGRYEEGSDVEFDFENTVIDRDIILIAKWEKNTSNGGGGWSGGGGGGGMKKDNCPDGDFSPSYYDGECGGNSHGSAESNTGDETPQPQQPEQTPVDPQPLPPTETSPGKGQTSSEGQNTELADMHQRAYENGLTIYKPGEDAKFDKPLTRQQMAKISSIFGAKFLNQKADDSEGKVYACSQYTDLHKSKGEMRGYVVQSCLLGNMGYAYDGVNLIKKFNPYNKLTVEQASVILSRMAWGDKYVISPKKWYQGHMYAVYDHGLIDDISKPQREVTRGEAFMMMYRLSLLMK